jgi:uncharacterized protein YcfJ
MFTRVMTCVVVASVLAAPAALADPKHGPNGAYRNANQDYDYARVVHVEPIVRQVRVDVPQRECWTETRYDQPAQPSYGNTVGGTLVGGLIGGAIGHQIGAGRGKDAATVAGIVIGSALGHNAAARNQQQYASAQPQPYQVERCDNRIQQTYEERIDGYQVEYEYHGRHYFTRLPYDPGERLRVQVDVRPA